MYWVVRSRDVIARAHIAPISPSAILVIEQYNHSCCFYMKDSSPYNWHAVCTAVFLENRRIEGNTDRNGKMTCIGYVWSWMGISLGLQTHAIPTEGTPLFKSWNVTARNLALWQQGGESSTVGLHKTLVKVECINRHVGQRVQQPGMHSWWEHSQH